MNTIKTLEHKGIQIQIHQDDDAQNPAKNGDTNLFLVGLHNQFFIQPPNYPKGARWNSDALHQQIKDTKKTHWIFPLEAYIHSGVVLALSGEGNFPDRQWDVSQLGVVFVAKSEWRLSKKARIAANSLVAEWNQYLSGDVYGYVIGGDDGDSCWGFYGLDYCIEQAKHAAEDIAKKTLDIAPKSDTIIA